MILHWFTTALIVKNASAHLFLWVVGHDSSSCIFNSYALIELTIRAIPDSALDCLSFGKMFLEAI